ncbi:MAG: hypothetical protein JWQ34_3066 [Mucilaginibacter sp.]|uniref:hypothetical protein n=1 Tax=Mucilaginibacter sp. TaxID=1882438 RepID=UPI00261E8F76|nr:hypothetical protein [Mucilaginibacter sp.]MDB5004841.1 hypothetical protein [Mucilaginibacter sp.]
MKYLIKLILPPLFAFWAFAGFIKFTPFFHYVDTKSIGEDSIYGLIAYYKIFALGQIVIAELTQFLIVIPLWNKILARPRSAITIFSIMLLVCLIFAFGLAYIIWDPVTKIGHLLDIGLFMTGVQLFYWVLNFLLLYLLDWKAFKKTAPATETEK